MVVIHECEPKKEYLGYLNLRRLCQREEKMKKCASRIGPIVMEEHGFS